MISFTAHGIPTTQGSMRAFVVKGRAIVTHDNREKVCSWRSVVAAEAAKAMDDRELFDCPVSVRVLFVLPRPKSAPKRRLWPDRKPDLDKLTRAIFDSIRGVVYADDARVCDVSATKIYGSPARAEISVEGWTGP